jgi:hypothetical protein
MDAHTSPREGQADKLVPSTNYVLQLRGLSHEGW